MTQLPEPALLSQSCSFPIPLEGVIDICLVYWVCDDNFENLRFVSGGVFVGHASECVCVCVVEYSSDIMHTIYLKHIFTHCSLIFNLPVDRCIVVCVKVVYVLVYCWNESTDDENNVYYVYQCVVQ